MSKDNRRNKTKEKPAVAMAAKSGSDPIADALRRLHDTVAEEPMPDSFLELVAQIEAKIESRRG